MAERGVSVVVLERQEPGSGASGVAAGMLAPVTEVEFGEEALLRANLEAATLWPRFDAELRRRSGSDIGYTRSGALVVAADRDDAEELRRLHTLQRSLELDVEWLSGRECRRLEPGLSPRVGGGVLARGDHHVDPSAVVRALAAALEREGGELARGVAAASLELGDAGVRGVRLDGGATVAAGHVVVAAGPWSAQLAGVPETERPPVRPVKGQILSLRGPAGRPLAERLVRTPRCYVVSRRDGRVVIGATVEERGFDTRVTGEGVLRLLEAAWEVLPDVAELEWLGARAGLRPGTPDNAPALGAGAVEGLVWATGHYRNGVLLAPLTAAAVADLVTDRDPPAVIAGLAPGRFAGRRLAAGTPS